MDAGNAVRGKRFSIIGGARSGIAVAKLLKARGAQVFLSDKSPADKMESAAQELHRCGIDSEFGGNTERVLNADVVVLSPGVPSDVPIVRQAVEKNLRVVSEVEVASWFNTAPIIAVTGTNGKTTTTTLLGRIFEDARRPSKVGGNIGVAFSEIVNELKPESTAILEISSFQLDHIVSFKPRVSVLLNITPDHLDRYDHSFEKYAASKCRVFENQAAGDTVVFNHDDEVTRRNVEGRANANVLQLPFSVNQRLSNGAFVEDGKMRVTQGHDTHDIISIEDISIRGRHNLQNAMAATLAARAMGISAASIRSTLRNFKGVEHRLEFVREANGVHYINDSKATNVDSVWYALQSFDRPLVLLLGGRDKGNDYTVLANLVKKHVKAIIAIGESAVKVSNAFQNSVPVRIATSMPEALQAATELATRGDAVLLSPACASFDWFENYEHRGRVFKELVNRL